MLKSIEYPHCKPYQLNLFEYGTLDKVKYLSLYFNCFISENDHCWGSLPPNVLFIKLVVTMKLSSTEVVHTTNNKNPNSPSTHYEGKIGGLTFHECFNFRLIHLNPTKMTFLADDGSHEIEIQPFITLSFNNTPSLARPYSQVQIDTYFAPTFVVDQPTASLDRMPSYSSSIYLFSISSATNGHSTSCIS
ncbi:unnamed protein product [Ambrosiozyma monospora]|uniref:Unnamed protein product n=1 Tax=Ambrosiozyma monospora TaxID=43982 RepID=A0ACB5TA49_AMBMO|nr:unnamed protein product [Ambrosiozyma monospora]